MGMDQFKERPKFTLNKEEFSLLSELAMDGSDNLENPKLLALMKEKGIEFDQGVIEIGTPDGKRWEFVTDKNDFGTMVPIEDGAPTQEYDSHDHFHPENSGDDERYDVNHPLP